MLLLYWHTKPVHLISPHFNLPDTHIKHFFPTLLVGIPCCLSRTFGTYTPAAVVPHPYTFNSQFVGVQVGRLFNTLRPYHTLFDHRLRSFGFTRVYRSYYFGFRYTSTLVALRLRITLDFFVMQGCVDPFALVFFVFGWIPFSLSYVKDV